MCRVIETKVGNRAVRVADIKAKYMNNIADAARECDYIDKIVLFGSSTSSKCHEKSDIELALFGNVSRAKCLTSKKYERFLTKIFSFDDFKQAYDILYFKNGQKNNCAILEDIQKGVVLYDNQ